MKISIITATYNSSRTVRDTLESIRTQTYNHVEHIIIDGNSSDHTLKIVDEFPHVSIILSEPDRGIYHAMNKGIRLATGEVIGILNSDDIYTNEEVLKQIADIFADKTVDVCYADLQYVHQNDSNKTVRTWKSGSFTANSFSWGWMPPHPTVFVRRSVYDKVGIFNTRLKSSADYELMLRIFVKNNFTIRYLPEIIVKMRVGGYSNASIMRRLRANREDRLAWRLNGLSPYFFTAFLKPFRKVSQFFN